MSDQPYPSGVKPPVNTELDSASTGFVRTDNKDQSISAGRVNDMAQDYIEPDAKH